ncbi:MAG: methyltransferase [Gammaproteobacteria bacterium]
MNNLNWKQIILSDDQTHHVLDGNPIYASRFQKVLKFHTPGLAPVYSKKGAYHIDISGEPIYSSRYEKVFGYYEGYAAVQNSEGAFHIDTKGLPAYKERYRWCGNFQLGRSVVQDKHGNYFHIDIAGERVYKKNYKYVGDFRENRAVVSDNELCTHIDMQGNYCHGFWFLDLDVYHKNIACAKDEKGWFHIGLNGREIYRQRYAKIEPFYNDQARVERFDGSIEIIDLTGEVVHTVRESRASLLADVSSDFVAFWKTQMLAIALKLDLFSHLPAGIEVVSKKCGIDLKILNRVLRALWEIGYVYPDSDDLKKWCLSGKGNFLKEEPRMKAVANIWAGHHYDCWGNANNLSKDPESSPYFYELSKNQSELSQYQSALTLYSEEDYSNLHQIIRFEKHNSVVDVGGGVGRLIYQILENHSHLQGCLIELPEVISLIQAEDKHERCQYKALDFFQPWCIKADAIILTRVLHDWSDEKAVEILKFAESALTETGAIYLVEYLIEDFNPGGSLLDLNMLIMTGGEERNLTSWTSILAKANLVIESIQPMNHCAKLFVVKRRKLCS